MGDPAMHWTAQRKMELVLDVRRGRAIRADVLREHAISEEEFTAWEDAYSERGLQALQTGSSRSLRRLEDRRPEEAAPWRSTAAPGSLKELADWFTSQAERCFALAQTYGSEARMLIELGQRLQALQIMDITETIAAQAKSYEHAARLCADLGGAPE